MPPRLSVKGGGDIFRHQNESGRQVCENWSLRFSFYAVQSEVPLRSSMPKLSQTFRSSRRPLYLLALLLAFCAPLGASAAEAAEKTEHSLPRFAVPLAHIGPFVITNSMLVTWIVAVALIAFSQYATRDIQAIPSGAQNFWEWLVESLYDFLESVIGHELVKKTFWFFATVFIFILFTNWFSLIPGVGTIGWGHQSPQGGLFEITTPLFRGPNADLNMTLAMSTIFFACWIVWAIQAHGIGGFLMHLFGPNRCRMKPPMPCAWMAQTIQQAKKMVDIPRVMFKSAFAPRRSGRVISNNPPWGACRPHPMVPTPGMSPNQFVQRMKIKTVAKNQNVFFTKSWPMTLSKKL